MNILDKIIAHKKKEVEERKSFLPVNELEKTDHFSRKTISLKKALLNDSCSGVIAEFKRRSPSKGIINVDVDVQEVTSGYAKAGASALSILTDEEFFGGTSDDVLSARSVNRIPILRKEFIIDEYQIIEAKAMGADVILLLANVLTPREIKQFATTAKFLGLEVLLELRDRSELKAINMLVDCVGVNNRNLKDFKVHVKQSFDLAKLIPNEFIKVSESGIDSTKTIRELKQAGFRGFLIGETFMRESNPAATCEKLIKEINR